MGGDGSIYRRDERTWVAQLSIGSRVSRRYVRRNAPTRAAARAALEELKAEHRAGVHRSRITTGDYLERWVAEVRNIRPSTRRGYANAVAYHLNPAIGHVRLFDLSPLDVEGMLSRHSGTMSPKLLRNVHAVLRRALTHAVRSGLVTRNVASREYVDAPSVTVDEPEAFSTEEVRALLHALEGDPPMTDSAQPEGLRAALERLQGLDYRYGGWWRTDADEWASEEDVPEELKLALHDFLALVRADLAEQQPEGRHEHDWTASSQPGPRPGMPASVCADPNCPNNPAAQPPAVTRPGTRPIEEVLTRISDEGHGRWHDEVLPNGAIESWACVPIGRVIEAVSEWAEARRDSAGLDVERLAVSIRLESVRNGQPLSMEAARLYAHALEGEYRRLSGSEGDGE